jgi:hypothetical protein
MLTAIASNLGSVHGFLSLAAEQQVLPPARCHCLETAMGLLLDHDSRSDPTVRLDILRHLHL